MEWWKSSDFGRVNVKTYEQEKTHGELRQIYTTHNPGTIFLSYYKRGAGGGKQLDSLKETLVVVKKTHTSQVEDRII